MSANCQTADGMAGWSAAPLGFAPPRSCGGSLAVRGPVATALHRARQFLRALRGTKPKHPGGSGGRPPEPPELPDDHPGAASLWDDPAFWLWVMH
jgi:hypothetical protein